MSEYYRAGEHYVLMEPMFSFEQFDEFVMQEDGLLHGPDDLTLEPEIFEGKKGHLLMAWKPNSTKGEQ